MTKTRISGADVGAVQNHTSAPVVDDLALGDLAMGASLPVATQEIMDVLASLPTPGTTGPVHDIDAFLDMVRTRNRVALDDLLDRLP